MIIINKNRFFYAIIIIIIVDLIIDGIDDFGTRLYLIHLIRSLVILGLALVFSISFKKTKKKYPWRNCIEYVKDNPKGYWFKRKLYGWGWVPVKWQGWLVVAISISIFIVGIYVGETDDAPGATGLGFLLMIAIIFAFGYWKGEKPKWSWGRTTK